MTVLFRQAWTWLQNRHEPAIVGTAVALFGLAYLLPLANAPIETTQSSVSANDAQPTEFALGLYDVPQDEQFYRDKWIAEANAFYTANPPKTSESQSVPSMVIAASMRAPAAPLASNSTGEPPIQDANVKPSVAQASHLNPLPPHQAQKKIQAPTQTTMALPANAQRWRVITCLASGLLASLMFVSIWPARPSTAQPSPLIERPMEIVGRGEAIPVRIPSRWIGVRPTLRQTAKRSVLAGSYLIAAIGAWGIVS